MLTPLRGHVSWLRQALGKSANPLRRPIDRVTATITALLLVLSGAAVPAAMLFGFTVHTNLSARAERVAATADSVGGVLTTPPRVNPSMTEGNRAQPKVVTATVAWRTEHGPRRDTLRVPVGSAPGDNVRVWVDAAGNRVPPPASKESIITSAVFAAGLLLLVVELVSWSLIIATQHVARLVAGRAWEREWILVQRGGSWSQP